MWIPGALRGSCSRGYASSYANRRMQRCQIAFPRICYSYICKVTLFRQSRQSGASFSFVPRLLFFSLLHLGEALWVSGLSRSPNRFAVPQASPIQASSISASLPQKRVWSERERTDDKNLNGRETSERQTPDPLQLRSGHSSTR